MSKEIKRTEFIKNRGYFNYKRLAKLCKFFDIKLDDMLEKSLDTLDILLGIKKN